MKEINNNIDEAISYLVVLIAGEKYALHVRDVLNILEIPRITQVPLAPDYMKGIMNLRGDALPVIDTYVKLGMTPSQITSNSCIIVMRLKATDEEIMIGALVDAVDQVVEIEDSMIGPPPSLGSTYTSSFISGIAKIDEEFVMILDYLLLFNSKELEVLQNIDASEKIENNN